ncbi:MAG TPA: hypothetical protein VNW46_05150 [Gemmatimonadaceae bacterium]|nr:hypothetical protein [Gemmatimonadaceae bacterium]
MPTNSKPRLGPRTETDAVARAPEAVRRQQQVQGLRTLASLGPIDATRIAD